MKAWQQIVHNAPTNAPFSRAYGNYYKLKQPVSAECWNHLDGSMTDLPVDTMLKVEHAYDGRNTTCMMQDIPDGFVCSNGQRGYRFIINNVLLRDAIGVHIPDETYDLVGAIIEAEA